MEYKDRRHFEEELNKSLEYISEKLIKNNNEYHNLDNAKVDFSNEAYDAGNQIEDEKTVSGHEKLFYKHNPHTPSGPSHAAHEDYHISLNHYKKTGKVIKYPKDQWSKEE